MFEVYQFDPKEWELELIADGLESLFYKECVILHESVKVSDTFEDNYYDVKFSNGQIVHGLSGYHLVK